MILARLDKLFYLRKKIKFLLIYLFKRKGLQSLAPDVNSFTDLISLTINRLKILYFVDFINVKRQLKKYSSKYYN
jgi:hypothetical protein